MRSGAADSSAASRPSHSSRISIHSLPWVESEDSSSSQWESSQSPASSGVSIEEVTSEGWKTQTALPAARMAWARDAIVTSTVIGLMIASTDAPSQALARRMHSSSVGRS